MSYGIRVISFPYKLNCRSICSSNICFGKKNVRKFPLFHFRWTRAERERLTKNPDPDIPVYQFGVRKTGFTVNGQFREIPEMIPELIVPDLSNCKLKPYVSYKAAEVIQSEFTAHDLFDAVYSRKIEDDFKAGKLNPDGSPVQPNDAEKLTPEKAKTLARKTGSDIFCSTEPYNLRP